MDARDKVKFVKNDSIHFRVCTGCKGVATLSAHCHVRMEALVPCCTKEECKLKAVEAAVEIANCEDLPIM